MKKQAISLLTSLLMVVSLVGVAPLSNLLTVNALSGPAPYVESGDYQYVILDDGTAEIVRYIGNEENLVIPKTLDGLTVTSIDAWQGLPLEPGQHPTGALVGAFEGCDSIKSVVIPDTVTNIGVSTFAYCVNLESVTIPSSVKNIASSVFALCNKLSDIYYNGTEEDWNKITISDYNEELKYAKIHYSDNSDINYLEYGDYQYKILDDGTAEIVRYNGNELTVVIPSKIEGITVTSIGYMLTGETSLPGSNIPESCKGAFQECEAESIIVPDTVTTIDQYAFVYCSNLTNLKLSSNLKIINFYGIYGCDKLTNLILPDGLEHLAESSIYSCPNIKSIIIPKSVNKIDDRALGYSGRWWPTSISKNDLTIKCYSGTAGHQYAIDNEFAFELLDPELQGTVYYQTKASESAVRFIAEVDIDDVVNADQSNVKIMFNGQETSVQVTKAYGSLIANDQKIEAQEGKCFIISPAIMTNNDGGDVISAEFTLGGCKGSIIREITV